MCVEIEYTAAAEAAEYTCTVYDLIFPHDPHLFPNLLYCTGASITPIACSNKSLIGLICTTGRSPNFVKDTSAVVSGRLVALVLLMCLSVALVSALAVTFSRTRRRLFCNWLCLRPPKEAQLRKNGARADADVNGGGGVAAPNGAVLEEVRRSAHSRPTRGFEGCAAPRSPVYRQLALSVSASPEPLPLPCGPPPDCGSGVRILASPSKRQLLYVSNGHAAIPVTLSMSSKNFTAPAAGATSKMDTDSCNGSLSQTTAMRSVSSREPLVLPSTSLCYPTDMNMRLDDSMTRSLDSSIAWYTYALFCAHSFKVS